MFHPRTAVLVAALVLASGATVGLAAATSSGSPGAIPEAADGVALAQEEPNATAGANETSNVTFENQSSNGTVVVVNRTVLPEGGFIAIHLYDEENDTFGDVIGNSSYLEAGTHENVTVTLDPAIEEGQFLVAMNHLDTNDNQVYEFPEADDPYVADGAPVTDRGFVEVGAMAVVEPPADDGAGNETAGNETDGA